MRRLLPCLLISLTAGCTTDPPPGGCVDSVGCDPGQICDSGSCRDVCVSDSQCDPGQICQGDLCVTGARSDIPTITGVTGNGSTACESLTSAVRCLGDGILVIGQNLSGTSLSLTRPGGNTDVLAIVSSSATEIEAQLPTDVMDNETSLLTVANAAGEAQINLQLLEGAPGPDLTADEIITRLNMDGTSTFDVSLLPVGTAPTTVSRGDHNHGSFLPLAGGTLSGALNGTDAVFSGSVTVGADPGACAGRGGALRWTMAGLELCDDASWQIVYGPRPDGSSQLQAAPSCRDIKRNHPGSSDGLYWVDPGAGATDDAMQVHCDMTTDGGGWTVFMQCRALDNCKVGSTNLYNTNWLNNDFGTVQGTSSYLKGQPLRPILGNAESFLVEIQHKTNMDRGFLKFPLDAFTLPFFQSSGFYESRALRTTVIDTDNSQRVTTGKICWASSDVNRARTYQGTDMLSFMGQTTATPIANANTGCDYGPWASQMLIRNQDIASLTANWGQAPAATWADQNYQHRISVR